MEFIIESNEIYLVNEKNEKLAYVTFPEIKEGVVEINHTVVDPSLRGQGVAGKLLNKCYEVLKERNLKAKPTCSYAVSWFEKNLDKKDILA